jgi:hypothetical protein
VVGERAQGCARAVIEVSRAVAARADDLPAARIGGRLLRAAAWLVCADEGTRALNPPQARSTAERAEIAENTVHAENAVQAESTFRSFARSAFTMLPRRALRALRWTLLSRERCEVPDPCAVPPACQPATRSAINSRDVDTSGAQASGNGGFRRLVYSALASLLLYGVLFGAVLDQPLELGFLARQLDDQLARAATIHQPKLLILAGSNGPYSHRCEVIEPMLALPCVNGGVAVGIGLDYLFTRWRPLLHAGDIVYLPMEQQQYATGRVAMSLGPDAAIMFRHDWTTLAALAPKRWLASLFAFDLRAGLMSLIEMSLVAVRFHDPRAATTGTSNAWGDHVGHSIERGAGSQGMIAAMATPAVSATAIRDGYGTRQIAGFVAWARAHGVRVIGGLPTELDQQPLPEATRAAIAAVYLAHGGEFLTLPNRSRYPVADFFDTPLHLNEACQIAHSITLARALAVLLGRTARAAPPDLVADRSIGPVTGVETDPSSECPSAATATALAQAPR